MKYSRDTNFDLHAIQEVEASTPEEAAKIIKEELETACRETYNNPKSLPSFLQGKSVDYISEIWEESVTFYDENGNEYDSFGKLIPTDDDDDEFDGVKFIWGIKSADDLSFCEVSAYTMNDIEINYIKEEDMYCLDFEQAYVFEKKEQMIVYLNKLADLFEKYLLENGYDKDEINHLQSSVVYSEYYSTSILDSIFELKASTLIELYKKFRLFIKMFSAIIL